MEPLELRRWIHYVKNAGLVATIDDFASLPLGEPTIIYPLEYSKFSLHEYGDEYPDRSEPMDCHQFFEPLKCIFTRIGGLETTNGVLQVQNGEVVETSCPSVTGDFKAPDYPGVLLTSLYALDGRRIATHGSGDGSTSYVIASRLTQPLPPLYNGPDYR